MGKRYLLFASHAYAFSIMRPLQREIRRRGGEAAWFLEDTCPDMLHGDELRLMTTAEVRRWNPVAVFAPGNHIYDFFPGVKVELFHGFPVRKRGERGLDDHFKIRGWFDVYCTQGPSSTETFRRLEREKGFFKVYETGWPKLDDFFPAPDSASRPGGPLTVLYSSTFTRGISSAPVMVDEIRRMAAEKPWRWKIILHPKITDPAIVGAYERLAEEFDNVEFHGYENGVDLFRQSDVMLSDSSSIIVEYLMTGKPVVTYRNTCPGPHIINVEQLADIPAAIERAASRPAELMREMEMLTMWHDPHRDGLNSARVLDAVDDFIANHAGRLRRKPLNLVRRLKIRLFSRKS